MPVPRILAITRWFILLAVIVSVLVGGGVGCTFTQSSSVAGSPSPFAVVTATTTAITGILPTATPVTGVARQPTPLEATTLIRTAQAGTAQAIQIVTQTAHALEIEIAALFAGARRVFYDEFVDNRNAWFTGVFQEVELDVIEDGVFKVFWTGRGASYELYELSSFTDFIAEVDCRIARGSGDGSCALVFAHQKDVGFYKFELFIDYYRLSVIAAAGDPVILAEGDPRRLTTVDTFNRLRVIRQGARIRVFINDVLVAEVNDTTYPSGRIGVSTACYRAEGGVEVQFDNIAIWSFP
ncbi:MAG: family 16 glycoside hydrolase [Chloroflexus sp.]